MKYILLIFFYVLSILKGSAQEINFWAEPQEIVFGDNDIVLRHTDFNINDIEVVWYKSDQATEIGRGNNITYNFNAYSSQKIYSKILSSCNSLPFFHEINLPLTMVEQLECKDDEFRGKYWRGAWGEGYIEAYKIQNQAVGNSGFIATNANDTIIVSIDGTFINELLVREFANFNSGVNFWDNVFFQNLPVFSDNSAAISAGAVIGSLYRDSTGILKIVY
jgi:hypothetical protein